MVGLAHLDPLLHEEEPVPSVVKQRFEQLARIPIKLVHLDGLSRHGPPPKVEFVRRRT